MADDCRLTLETPLGQLLLISRAGRLTAIVIAGRAGEAATGGLAPPAAADGADCPVLARAARQLQEYFAGHRRNFDLPLALPAGSPFRQRVYRLLCRVPYADTLTYGELAAQAGSPGAARAIGQVMARNPLPIVVPCHRVISTAGGLGGYSGGEGLPTKAWLLAFERGNLQSF